MGNSRQFGVSFFLEMTRGCVLSPNYMIMNLARSAVDTEVHEAVVMVVVMVKVMVVILVMVLMVTIEAMVR